MTWATTGDPSFAETRKLDGNGPTLHLVKASARKLTRAQLAPASYITLAKSVGVEPEEAEILQAIYETGLNTYDFAKVDAYLYRAALRQGTRVRWVWKTLRDKDTAAISRSAWSSQSGVGLISNNAYTQQIPMRVLTEMKAFMASMPDAVFMVSDYEVMKPDPFLAVTTPKLLASGKIWIVDQWNEPGFGTDETPNMTIEPVKVQLSQALVPAIH